MATLISPNVRQLHKRTTGSTIHSLLWYLWGLFCFSFGLAGGILHGASDTTVGVLFVGCCLAGLIILIPLLLYRISFFLIWWARLIMESGVLVVGLVLLTIVSVAHAPVQVLGIIFVLYGIAADFVAFW